MFKKLTQYYQYFSNLSLDVVLGVFCCMLPLPGLFNSNMPFVWYVGLPVCTWLVYISDHFYDMHRNPSTDTERHRFISDHQKIIIRIALMIMLFVGILTIRFAPYFILLSGFLIFCFCLLYYLLLRYSFHFLSIRYLNKDLMVAFIYTSAVYISFITGQLPSLPWLLYYLIFFLLVYQNLLLMSISEIKSDTLNQDYSTTFKIGLRKSTLLFHGCSFMMLILLVVLYAKYNCHYLCLSYLLMGMANQLLMRYVRSNMDAKHIRKISEMVFWIPGIAYLIWKII